MTKRADIIERLAMALPGHGILKPTAAIMRKHWKAASHSLQSVYRGAAEDIIRDTRKLGLRISLSNPTKRKAKRGGK